MTVVKMMKRNFGRDKNLKGKVGVYVILIVIWFEERIRFLVAKILKYLVIDVEIN